MHNAKTFLCVSSLSREFVSSFALRLIRVLQANEFFLDETLNFDLCPIDRELVERFNRQVQLTLLSLGFFPCGPKIDD